MFLPLFVMCIDPFLEHLHQVIERKDLGVIRACADDVGAAIRDFRYLNRLFHVFRSAREIANLTLKPSKCNLVPSSLPFSPETVQYISSWIQSNIPDWAALNIVPHAKYLGFIMGPIIKEVQWSGVFSKWLARGKAIANSHACPGTTTFSYNHTGVPILGYRGQLIELPHDAGMRERHFLHFLWHIPTNTLDLSTFFNTQSLGAYHFQSVKCFCKASMFRAASQTISGWEQQVAKLKRLVLDHLPASSWTFDVLAPSFWDTPAYVQNLAACVAGIPSDSDLCKAVREIKQVLARMERGRLCKKAPHHALGFGHSKIPIQSIAYSCLVKHLYPDNIHHLVKRRLTTLGVLELGSQLFNADVWTQTVQFYKISDPYCTICWLKTFCNGWCTSFRMHEPIFLPCVFGCL